MFIAKKKAGQSEFWIAADQVVTSTKGGFYAKLEETPKASDLPPRFADFAFRPTIRAASDGPGLIRRFT